MIASEYLAAYLRIATAVVPVGVYFLILGLLNSRRHPQMLSGRQDFALLMSAISPLFVVPVLQYIGMSIWSVAAAAAGVAGLILLLAPRGRTWVVYNLSAAEARKVVAQALLETRTSFSESRKGFHLEDSAGFVELGGFSLLRNVSITMRGCDRQASARFESALSAALASCRTEANPAGVTMLLVATASLIAPFAMIAHEVPEIVRLLSDLF